MRVCVYTSTLAIDGLDWIFVVCARQGKRRCIYRDILYIAPSTAAAAAASIYLYLFIYVIYTWKQYVYVNVCRWRCTYHKTNNILSARQSSKSRRRRPTQLGGICKGRRKNQSIPTLSLYLYTRYDVVCIRYIYVYIIHTHPHSTCISIRL